MLGYSGNFSVESLDRAVNAIAHRGPDDSGVFVDQEQKIGLGHTRLSIQDVSNSAISP